MGTTLNVHVTEAQAAWLEREAQRLGTSLESVVACRIEEAWREDDFPFVEFREAFQGRDAFLRGTRLKIWLLINHVRANDGNIAKTAMELEVPETAVENAVAYAAVYASEIDAAIMDSYAAADRLREELTAASVTHANASHS